MTVPNPLRQLNAAGQSVWYDYIRRDLLGEELATLIERVDGMVSLEVSPDLAHHDTAATVREARTLWQRLDRPNAPLAAVADRAGELVAA